MTEQDGIVIKWAKPVKFKLSLFTGLFNLTKDVLTGEVAKIPADFIPFAPVTLSFK